MFDDEWKQQMTMKCSADVELMEYKSEDDVVMPLVEGLVTVKQEEEVEYQLLLTECSADVGVVKYESEDDVLKFEQVLVAGKQEGQARVPEMSRFAILLFQDGLQVVPQQWLYEDENLCYWPANYNSIKLVKAVARCEMPRSDWVLLKIVRHFGTAGTYESAQHKLKICEAFSDIESGSDDSKNKRKRHIHAKKVCCSESSSSESECEGSQSLLQQIPKLRKIFKPLSTSMQNTMRTSCSRQVQDNHDIEDCSSKDLQINPRSENTAEKEMLKLVLKKMDKIIYKLDAIEERLTSLEKNTSSVAISTQENRDIISNCPLKTVEDVEQMELLLVDKANCDALFSTLKPIGGRQLKETVVNLLRRLFTNNLAVKYSWLGAKGKINFKKLKLMAVIYRVVFFHMPSATEVKVAEFVAAWLKHAKARRDRQSGKTAIAE